MVESIRNLWRNAHINRANSKILSFDNKLKALAKQKAAFEQQDPSKVDMVQAEKVNAAILHNAAKKSLMEQKSADLKADEEKLKNFQGPVKKIYRNAIDARGDARRAWWDAELKFRAQTKKFPYIELYNNKEQCLRNKASLESASPRDEAKIALEQQRLNALDIALSKISSQSKEMMRKAERLRDDKKQDHEFLRALSNVITKENAERIKKAINNYQTVQAVRDKHREKIDSLEKALRKADPASNKYKDISRKLEDKKLEYSLMQSMIERTPKTADGMTNLVQEFKHFAVIRAYSDKIKKEMLTIEDKQLKITSKMKKANPNIDEYYKTKLEDLKSDRQILNDLMKTAALSPNGFEKLSKIQFEFKEAQIYREILRERINRSAEGMVKFKFLEQKEYHTKQKENDNEDYQFAKKALEQVATRNPEQLSQLNDAFKALKEIQDFRNNHNQEILASKINIKKNARKFPSVHNELILKPNAKADLDNVSLMLNKLYQDPSVLGDPILLKKKAIVLRDICVELKKCQDVRNEFVAAMKLEADKSNNMKMDPDERRKSEARNTELEKYNKTTNELMKFICDKFDVNNPEETKDRLSKLQGVLVELKNISKITSEMAVDSHSFRLENEDFERNFWNKELYKSDKSFGKNLDDALKSVKDDHAFAHKLVEDIKNQALSDDPPQFEKLQESLKKANMALTALREVQKIKNETIGRIYELNFTMFKADARGIDVKDAKYKTFYENAQKDLLNQKQFMEEVTNDIVQRNYPPNGDLEQMAKEFTTLKDALTIVKGLNDTREELLVSLQKLNIRKIDDKNQAEIELQKNNKEALETDYHNAKSMLDKLYADPDVKKNPAVLHQKAFQLKEVFTELKKCQEHRDKLIGEIANNNSQTAKITDQGKIEHLKGVNDTLQKDVTLANQWMKDICNNFKTEKPEETKEKLEKLEGVFKALEESRKIRDEFSTALEQFEREHDGRLKKIEAQNKNVADKKLELSKEALEARIDFLDDAKKHYEDLQNDRKMAQELFDKVTKANWDPENPDPDAAQKAILELNQTLIALRKVQEIKNKISEEILNSGAKVSENPDATPTDKNHANRVRADLGQHREKVQALIKGVYDNFDPKNPAASNAEIKKVEEIVAAIKQVEDLRTQYRDALYKTEKRIDNRIKIKQGHENKFNDNEAALERLDFNTDNMARAKYAALKISSAYHLYQATRYNIKIQTDGLRQEDHKKDYQHASDLISAFTPADPKDINPENQKQLVTALNQMKQYQEFRDKLVNKIEWQSIRRLRSQSMSDSVYRGRKVDDLHSDRELINGLIDSAVKQAIDAKDFTAINKLEDTMKELQEAMRNRDKVRKALQKAENKLEKTYKNIDACQRRIEKYTKKRDDVKKELDAFKAQPEPQGNLEKVAHRAKLFKLQQQYNFYNKMVSYNQRKKIELEGTRDDLKVKIGGKDGLADQYKEYRNTIRKIAGKEPLKFEEEKSAKEALTQPMLESIQNNINIYVKNLEENQAKALDDSSRFSDSQTEFYKDKIATLQADQRRIAILQKHSTGTEELRARLKEFSKLIAKRDDRRETLFKTEDALESDKSLNEYKERKNKLKAELKDSMIEKEKLENEVRDNPQLNDAEKAIKQEAIDNLVKRQEEISMELKAVDKELQKAREELRTTKDNAIAAKNQYRAANDAIKNFMMVAAPTPVARKSPVQMPGPSPVQDAAPKEEMGEKETKASGDAPTDDTKVENTPASADITSLREAQEREAREAENARLARIDITDLGSVVGGIKEEQQRRRDEALLARIAAHEAQKAQTEPAPPPPEKAMPKAEPAPPPEKLMPKVEPAPVAITPVPKAVPEVKTPLPKTEPADASLGRPTQANTVANLVASFEALRRSGASIPASDRKNEDAEAAKRNTNRNTSTPQYGSQPQKSLAARAPKPAVPEVKTQAELDEVESRKKGMRMGGPS